MNAATADARTAVIASAAEVAAPDGAGAAATGAGLGTCAHAKQIKAHRGVPPLAKGHTARSAPAAVRPALKDTLKEANFDHVV